MVILLVLGQSLLAPAKSPNVFSVGDKISTSQRLLFYLHTQTAGYNKFCEITNLNIVQNNKKGNEISFKN
jgi:hypothetical protein